MRALLTVGIAFWTGKKNECVIIDLILFLHDQFVM